MADREPIEYASPRTPTVRHNVFFPPSPRISWLAILAASMGLVTNPIGWLYFQMFIGGVPWISGPLLGIALSTAAILRIRLSSGTYDGEILALIGLVLSTSTLVIMALFRFA